MGELRSLKSILAEHRFCEDLPLEYLDLLVGCASNTRFAPGEYLMRESEEADQFFLIRAGRVALRIHAPERWALTLQTLGEGEMLGWSWLIPPHQFRFDAQAVEDTRAIALDGTCLRQKCESDPALGYDLLKRISRVLASRLEATHLQLLDVFGAPEAPRTVDRA